MPSIVSIDYVTCVYNFFYGTYDASIAGSDIIIEKNDKELMVGTNNHVVEDAKEIQVTFNDGTSVTGKVKGKDDVADLAVIAVSLDELSADTIKSISIAKFGNSDKAKTGEIAIAIGSFSGYGQTYGSLFQTDAAINSGNSGGALLNLNDEVIGINNAKLGATNTEGLGYAVFVSYLQKALTDILRDPR